uniref:Vacuolar protein sorting-associated protein 4 n=1 Tax=Stygiella incarcerata TaxID=1712417 RepID=A0A192ZIJ8_9EUKA|nr:vacuolar protein sorting-associated protein 4 [Stygiella incarcerata]|eukprot:TRINITY_DN1086_c0_g3_i1.p1 TRINITY_DN1086_c0_g3~~TRINITY_DN1086_c0_g3_i1.p1  ORF type:complete len:447 (-),score=153.02 TRINITY_DN1086_c0_g3_i1:78-1418(-)
MSFVDFSGRAMDELREAIQYDEKNDSRMAYQHYDKSANWFLTAMKHEKTDSKKKRIRSKLEEILDRMEDLKEKMDTTEDGNDGKSGGEASSKAKKKKKGSGGKKGGGGGSGGGGGGDDDEESEKMKNALSDAIVTEKPNVKWDDVAGLETAKDAIKEAVILPIRFPSLFTGKRTPWKGILLYGPPGTGKSFLAKAVATEADAMFFSVSSADLVSKWVGESEKLVRSLFNMAREQKPAIIFIDEVDSMCSSRSESESDSGRRIKTEFLIQMQGVGKDSDGILVLAATNLPWAIDSAIRRRFERRLYIPLPEAAARRRMFEIHIGDTPHSLGDEDFDYLADQTEGFSGSDISVLVRSALMEPVRTCQIATHFKKVKDPETGTLLWTPCTPGATGAVEMGLMDVKEGELYPPKVGRLDFERALASARPSVGADDLKEYEKFTEEFGQEG